MDNLKHIPIGRVTGRTTRYWKERYEHACKAFTLFSLGTFVAGTVVGLFIGFYL